MSKKQIYGAIKKEKCGLFRLIERGCGSEIVKYIEFFSYIVFRKYNEFNDTVTQVCVTRGLNNDKHITITGK